MSVYYLQFDEFHSSVLGFAFRGIVGSHRFAFAPSYACKAVGGNAEFDKFGTNGFGSFFRKGLVGGIGSVAIGFAFKDIFQNLILMF